ncbi:hypothetical protein GCM10009799_41230 [Nocardiopsis rhodophaea]|uniref:HTH tetR-type domain-containing protein n=1 Tax=Nocardiopsis rhodophaea TaxID=280238 RepID=A0ABP5EY72_9ACTN
MSVDLPGGRDGRVSRGSRRRAELLDAAVRVAERAGVAEVGHRSVARESGTSLGSVGYHFPDRIRLLQALFHHAVDQAEARMTAMAADSPCRAHMLAELLADSASEGRGRVLVEYELELLAARCPELRTVASVRRRLLLAILEDLTGEERIARHAVDEIEGIRFRVAVGAEPLSLRDARGRMREIFDQHARWLQR